MANNWYVRPTGTTYGAGNGTSYANAWSGFASIVWGAGGILAGDTLYIDGTHTTQLTIGNSGTSTAPITIDSYNTLVPAIINVTALEHALYAFWRNWLIIKNLKLTGTTVAHGTISSDGATSTNGTLALYTCNDSVLSNLEVYSNGFTHGITLRTCTRSTLSNIIVRNNTQHGLNISNSKQTTSSYITAYGNLRTGIIYEGYAPSGYELNSDHKLTHSESYGNGDGVYLKHGTRILIDTVYSHDNTLTTNGSAEGYGVAVQQTQYATIQYSTLAGNRTSGAEYWSGTADGATSNSNYGIFRGNIVYGHTLFTADTSGSNGLKVNRAVTGIVANHNIFYGNTRDFYVAGATDCFFCNNVLLSATGMFNENLFSITAVSGWTFSNNIFNNATNSVYAKNTTGNTSTFINNNFYAGPIFWNNAVVAATTLDTSAITTNPLLDANYAPASNSPTIGAGYKWWGTKARPISKGNKPIPDYFIDIGAVQSTFNPIHPTNIG
jgi:hypothetical protein